MTLPCLGKKNQGCCSMHKKKYLNIGLYREENEPDMKMLMKCFVNFRHWLNEAQYGDLLETATK